MLGGLLWHFHPRLDETLTEKGWLATDAQAARAKVGLEPQRCGSRVPTPKRNDTVNLKSCSKMGQEGRQFGSKKECQHFKI